MPVSVGAVCVNGCFSLAPRQTALALECCVGWVLCNFNACRRVEASACATTGVCVQWVCTGGIASGGFSRLGGLSQLGGQTLKHKKRAARESTGLAISFSLSYLSCVVIAAYRHAVTYLSTEIGTSAKLRSVRIQIRLGNRCNFLSKMLSGGLLREGSKCGIGHRYSNTRH